MPQNAKVGQLLSQKSRVKVRLSGAQYVEKKLNDRSKCRTKSPQHSMKGHKYTFELLYCICAQVGRISNCVVIKQCLGGTRLMSGI